MREGGVYQTKGIYLAGRRIDYLQYSLLPKKSVTANSMKLTEQAKVLKDEIRR